MNTLLTRKLITTFTKPGDVILDPMVGVGTTLVEGMLLGRNVVGVDIEDKFCKLVEGNIQNVEEINSKSRFKLRLGKAQVLCGDSRNLAWLLQEKMDAVVTSPPYGASVSKHAGGDKVRERFEGFMGESQIEARKYSEDEKNIGNLQHGRVDAVVTSPPFASTSIAKEFKSEEDLERFAKEQYVHKHGRSLEATKRFIKKSWQGYPKNAANISNLKQQGEVDAVITSPPFGEANRGSGIAKRGYAGKHGVDPKLHERHDRPLSDDPNNISNLPLGKVDTVITSPPFANIAKSKEGAISPHMQGLISQLSGIPVSEFAHDPERLREAVKIAQSKIPFKYSDNPNNIGNLEMGKVDAVLTSPPYAQQVKGSDVDKEKEAKALVEKCKNYSATPGRLASHVRMRSGYSQDPNNIGNLPPGSVDTVITSPPYESTFNVKQHTLSGIARRDPNFRREVGGYGKGEANIGNLRRNEQGVDAVITSPPFESSVNAPNDPDQRAERMRRAGLDPKTIVGGKARCGQIDWQYSKNPANIGNLKADKPVDAIVTSPPYAHESTASKPTKFEQRGLFKMGHSRETPLTEEDYRTWKLRDKGNIAKRKLFVRVPCAREEATHHDDRLGRKGTEWEWTKEVEVTPDNMDIQNQKSSEKGRTETYLEAMLRVYREMYKVLKPGGLAIIVLKNFIRQWKVVDLIGDTVKLCEFCGFKLVKRIRFVLPTESFWRTNYRLQYEKKFKKPFPEKDFETVYKFETCLVFEKV